MASDEESKISSKSINMLASGDDEDDEDDDDDDDLSNKGDLFNLDPQYIAEKARLRSGTLNSSDDDSSSDAPVVVAVAKPDVIPPSAPNARRHLEATQTTCVAWLSQKDSRAFEVMKDKPVKTKKSGVPVSVVVVAAQKENETPTQLTTFTTTTVAPGKNWPHLARLVTMPELVLLLRAVDDMGCTSELNASNADNPKGNKWSRLYDH